jgi:hypothetical protein
MRGNADPFAHLQQDFRHNAIHRGTEVAFFKRILAEFSNPTEVLSFMLQRLDAPAPGRAGRRRSGS